MNKQEALNVMTRQESFVKAGNEIYAMHCDGLIPYVESGFDLSESTFGPFVGDGNFRISEREWQAAREEYLAKFARDDESGECAELSYRNPEQWNGEGLPPAGVECEFKFHFSSGGFAWYVGTFCWSDKSNALVICDGDYLVIPISDTGFRPILTDREKAIDALVNLKDEDGDRVFNHFGRGDAESVLDAIERAGFKLEAK